MRRHLLSRMRVRARTHAHTHTHTHLRFNIDVTHGLSSHHGNLIQNDIFGVPDDNTQHILLRLARGDVNWRRDSPVIGENVHPHVQLALCEEGGLGELSTL